jgi:hypothetical protein
VKDKDLNLLGCLGPNSFALGSLMRKDIVILDNVSAHKRHSRGN